LQVCDCVQTWEHGKSNIRRCQHYQVGRHLAAALDSRMVDACCCLQIGSYSLYQFMM
jgi:hypothetical protein